MTWYKGRQQSTGSCEDREQRMTNHGATLTKVTEWELCRVESGYRMGK